MKIRLDELLIKRNLAANLKEARALIGAGAVFVDDCLSDKAGNLHDSSVILRVKTKGKYVSRGGVKLEKALDHFELNVTDAVCLDIGASSGGFTDCLLQRGAGCVYAVDVAYGQLDWKLRQDPRVIVLERFNARKLDRDSIKKAVDLAVMDASFISLRTLIPPLLPLFRNKVHILALIKPQFELPKSDVGQGGVVRTSEGHQQAIDSIILFAEDNDLKVEGVVESPILGPKGNKEFIISLTSAKKSQIL